MALGTSAGIMAEVSEISRNRWANSSMIRSNNPTKIGSREPCIMAAMVDTPISSRSKKVEYRNRLQYGSGGH